LRNSALDLAEECEGIQNLSDILCRGDLDHFHQTEFGVDIDDGAMCDECEGDVAIALAVLVELLRCSMLVKERLLDSQTGAGLFDRNAQRTHRVDHVGAFDDELEGVEIVEMRDVFEETLANESARAVDGPTAHPCLA
jgi:hypothetical protein